MQFIAAVFPNGSIGCISSPLSLYLLAFLLHAVYCSSMMPVVCIPLSVLRPVPSICTTPLMFVLLEVCLRRNSSSSSSSCALSTQQQVLNMLKTITELGRCSSIAAAGPSWPVVLPLVGALVSSSKVLRSSSWDMASLAQACSLLESLVGHTVVLAEAWRSSLVDSSGNAPPLMLSEAAHLSDGFEERLALSSLHSALLTCLSSLLGVLRDLAWLAEEIAQQLLCWEEVKEQFDSWKAGASAATKAGCAGASRRAAQAHDTALFECYLEQGERFSSLPISKGGGPSLPSADALTCEGYAVETVELLLARFGYSRVLSWGVALGQAGCGAQ